MTPPPPTSPLFPYTTLFRSPHPHVCRGWRSQGPGGVARRARRIPEGAPARRRGDLRQDRKSTRLNSSHVSISYAVFCLKKKSELELLSRSCDWLGSGMVSAL